MSKKGNIHWFRAAYLIHNAYTAWVILLLSLVVTVGAYFLSVRFVEGRLEDRFEFHSNKLSEDIQHHLYVYEQVLRSVVSYYYASEFVSRDEFATYIDNLDLNRHWPGIQGIGYAIPISPEGKEQHIQSVRADGFPEYDIKPPGERDTYTSILYLEPFDWRNRRAFGYDMYSNDMRREAMNRARATGEAATSGKITLVQETSEGVQNGFLTYLPLYATKEIPETELERLTNFQGWIYAAFRAGDLMDGVTSDKTFAIEFEVYDGSELNPDDLLYDSNGVVDVGGNPDVLNKTIHMALQGRPWTLFLSARSDFSSALDQQDLPKYVVMGGVIIDVLLFYVLLSLHFINRRVQNLAEERTQELALAKKDIDRQRAFSDAIIDSLPLALYVKDVKNNEVIRVNQYANHLFGIKDHVSVNLLQNFMSRIQHHYSHSVQKFGSSFAAQLDIETASGKRWFNVNQVMLKSDDGVDLLLGLATDVTERLESEKRFTTLFDSAPTGLMLVDSEQKIQLVNRAVCEIFGYTSNELMGNSVNVLVPKPFHDKHNRHMALFSENPYPRKMTARPDLAGVAKDGTHVHLDIALQPLPYDEKNFVLVSVTDISERYKLIQQLEQANRYKSEFLASMSHELRTPLNSIIGFTERVLKRSQVLDERSNDALKTVQRNAHHLLSLINDILDLSKVESGRMELDLEVLDLRQVVDVHLQALAPWAKTKGLQYSVSLPKNELLITTDKSKLLRILNNLVSNAVKYTDEGRVSVTVSALTDEQLGVAVKIQVDDTGIGIEEVDQRKLFNEFIRVDDVRIRNIEGTGLGLVIVDRLISLMGGRIEMQSEYGNGSTFIVYLPIDPT